MSNKVKIDTWLTLFTDYKEEFVNPVKYSRRVVLFVWCS